MKLNDLIITDFSAEHNKGKTDSADRQGKLGSVQLGVGLTGFPPSTGEKFCQVKSFLPSQHEIDGMGQVVSQDGKGFSLSMFVFPAGQDLANARDGTEQIEGVRIGIFSLASDEQFQLVKPRVIEVD